MSLKSAPAELRVPEFTKHEVESVKALYAGEASPEQQRRALALIVNRLARAHDVSYVPRDPHASSFLAGRAFVGAQVLKLVNLPVGALIIQETKSD